MARCPFTRRNLLSARSRPATHHRRRLSPSRQRVTRRVTRSADSIGLVVASVRRSAALCREHMRLAESRPGDLKQALRPLIDLMSEQLAEGMARGQVREGDPEELAAFVYNLVSTTVHAILLAQDMSRVAAVDRISLAERVWAFCRRGVAP